MTTSVETRDLNGLTNFLSSLHSFTPFKFEEQHRTKLEELARRQDEKRRELLELINTIANSIWEVAIIGVVAEALIELRLNSVREMLRYDSAQFYKLVRQKFGQSDFVAEVRRNSSTPPAAEPQIPPPRQILITMLGTAAEMLALGEPPPCDSTDQDLLTALRRWESGVEVLRGFAQRAEREFVAESLCRHLYAAGKVDLRQLALIVDEPVEDLLFRLDRYNCSPPTAKLKLSAAKRSEILRRAVAHDPKSTDESSIRRSVISSQRIEGIDARGHKI